MAGSTDIQQADYFQSGVCILATTLNTKQQMRLKPSRMMDRITITGNTKEET
jgi:hypothetical protein